MKQFYSRFVLIVALLFSCSAYSVPVPVSLDMIASPGAVSLGDSVRFDLSFSEPVGNVADPFFGMFLDIGYDSNYLMPLYGLGVLGSCTGGNCGSASADLAFYDPFPPIPEFAYLDIYPLDPPPDSISGIGFITFEVIGDENTDIDTLVTADGFYDTESLIKELISGQGSVTILASQTPPGTVPEPSLPALMLISLVSLFLVSIKKKRAAI